MLRLLFFVCCFVTLSPVALAAEDVVVIVNQKIGVNKMTRDEVINIFLGRSRQLASGVTALPLDLPGTSAERAQFYQHLTGKTMNEINAYWARLIFSGRASPPAQVRSHEEAVQMVMDNRSAVGYVSRSKVSPSVTIVFELNLK
ncbi:MAG: hypothetical protein WC736_05625 [Gallionella sp.]|jgi:ABC-type phosphate transport system substrate-binding protein